MIASVEYVLPLATDSDEGLDELTAYLELVASWMPVTVVDGSEPDLFDLHAARWRNSVGSHIRPVRNGQNGKVDGVMTGVRASAAEVIVIADDDVRYTADSMDRALRMLSEGDLVRPQNYFDPLPWHGRWDTGRALINRAFHSDFPGTLLVRRQTLLAAGGYSSDVLFENLELIRAITAAGGRVVRADDVFVRRIPPTFRHFLSQRIRQAYDSRAQPSRMVAELALLPVILWSFRRPFRLLVFAGVIVAAAEVGRRRAGGRGVYGRASPLWALPWVAERAATAWVALATGLRGGVEYRGHRLRTAAHSVRALRKEMT